MQKAHFKRKYVPHLDEGTDFVVLSSQEGENPAGGRPKENVRFTVEAFKQLCMLTNTPKSKQVRKYYLALETLVFQYQKEQEAIRQIESNLLLEAAVVSSKEETLHNTLLQVHSHTQGIYFNKLETLSDGRFVLKIGETVVGLKSRAKAWQSEFGTKGRVMLFLPTPRSRAFEQDYEHRSGVQKIQCRPHCGQECAPQRPQTCELGLAAVHR